MVLSSGAAIEYDWLVLALGSDSVTFGIQGVREHALPFCTFDDALRVGHRQSCRRTCPVHLPHQRVPEWRVLDPEPLPGGANSCMGWLGTGGPSVHQ